MSDARTGVLLRSVAAVLGLAFLGYFAVREAGAVQWQLLVDLTIAGVATGGIFALAGMGLVLTYKATGVFNFAYGAIGAFVAFLLWQLNTWGWPLWVAAPLTLLVLGPLLGALLERLVFRPLEAREASVAEQLVATVGVYIIIVGISFAIWSPETKNAVSIFPSDPLQWTTPLSVGGEPITLTIGVNQLATVGLAIVLAGAIGALFAFTSLGTRIRAVVDRRELAELTSIDANRVSSLAWAIGCGLAGFTGVLLAPTFGLNPVRLPLVVIETFAVAVIARLVSLPLAIGGGMFLGFATSYANSFHFGEVLRFGGDVANRLFGTEPAAEGTVTALNNALDPMLTSLAVFVLFGALMLNRRLETVGEDDAGSLVARSTIEGKARPRAARRVLLGTIAALVALPLGLDPGTYAYAHRMIGLAVVFASIVAVTGFSGHITLGQAGFAGLGAFFTARLMAGTMLGLPALPAIPAMLLAALFCVPVGFIAGYPALKRRGLFLGLTTLAVGLVLSRYVFQNFYFNATSLMAFERPSIFGLSLAGDRAFYYFELVVFGGVVWLVRNLRTGRLGRILSAMRDSETASRSIGISLRRYKLFIFSASAFVAGLGGSLLVQQAEAFSSEPFVAFISLVWFATVVVAGVTSIYGALLGAALLTMLDGFLGLSGVSYMLIGLAAIALGQLPGGLVGLAKRVTVGGWVPRGLREAYAHGTSRSSETPTSYEPSDFARRVLTSAPSSNGEASVTSSQEARR